MAIQKNGLTDTDVLYTQSTPHSASLWGCKKKKHIYNQHTLTHPHASQLLLSPNLPSTHRGLPTCNRVSSYSFFTAGPGAAGEAAGAACGAAAACVCGLLLAN